MWGEIGASALSAGANIYGASKSAKSAKNIAAMQIAWERERAQNAIQWGVQDALKAGINPAVAAGAPASTSAINPPMPDNSGYGKAGESASTAMQLMLGDRQTSAQEKVADSEAGKNKAETIESGVRTNLLPRETAIKEYNSATLRMQAQQDAQESQQRIRTMVTLLPGQNESQKLENAQKAIQLTLDKENLPAGLTEAEINKRQQHLDNLINKYTGGLFTASEIKNAVAGAVGFVAGKKMLSAGSQEHAKAQQRDHRVIHYDKKGKLSGTDYYEWKN